MNTFKSSGFKKAATYTTFFYQVFVLVSVHRLSLSLNSNYLLKEWQQILQTLWGVVGFPSGTVVKNPPTNAGDARSDPWVGKWQPTAVFLLENPMDGGAWRAKSMGRKESDRTERLTLSPSQRFYTMILSVALETK